AASQQRLIARDVEQHGVAKDGAAWLEAATGAVLAHLADSPPLSARELREAVPELTGTVTVDTGKAYGGTFQIAPRVLTMLGAQGRIARGPNAAHWRLNRPTWTLVRSWLGEQPEPLPSPE